MPNTVRFYCVLAAKPEKVYRAFLEVDALAKWLPPNGFACTVHHLEPRVGGTFKMSFRNFRRATALVWRRIYRVGSERTPALHGQIRRSQPARRHSGDGHVEDRIGRHRAQHRAGRPAGHDSAGGLLSRMAGVVAKLGMLVEPESTNSASAI